MLFRCFAKHVLPKQAIPRNCETSETTHLVSRNSKTRFVKPFRQKPYLRRLWSCAMRYPCQNKTVFRMALPTVYALTLFRFILSPLAKFRRSTVDFFAISAKFKLNSGEIHLYFSISFWRNFVSVKHIVSAKHFVSGEP
jgi:hypothetical protein